MKASERDTLGRAAAARERGDLDAAAQLLRGLTDDHEVGVEAVTMHGSILIQQERFREATDLLEGAEPRFRGQPSFDFQLGLARQRNGDAAGAMEAYARALPAAPSDPNLRLNMGAACKALGDLEGAREHFEVVAEKLPDHPGVLNNLALVHKDLEELERAESLLRKALDGAPDMFEAWNSLGSVLHRLGRGEEALQAYDRALALRPASLEVRLNIGGTLDDLGRSADALELFDAMLAQLPGNLDVIIGRSDALYSLSRYKEALADLEAMTREHPDDERVYRKSGYVLLAMDRPEAALAVLERGLERVPDEPQLSIALAESLERLNRLERADEVLDAIPASGRKDPRYLLLRSVLERRAKIYEPGIERLTEAVERGLTQGWERAYRFELGRLHEACKDAERAFPEFQRANRISEQLWAHRHGSGPNRFLERVRGHAERLADPAWLKSWNPLPPPDDDIDVPVFLVGFPRSGTTLLDQILDAHPKIQVAEEKPMTNQVMNELIERGGGDLDRGLAELDEAGRGRIRERYWEEFGTILEREPGTIMVDKFPLLSARAHIINRVFPEAKFIFALRHPCDAVLSCFMQDFTPNVAMVNFYRLESAVDVYESVMRVWHAASEQLGLDYTRVRYEDLLEDLESQVRPVLEQLGVGWDDAVEDHVAHAHRRGRISTPSYQQVSQPLYTHARHRWQRYRSFMDPLLPRLAPFCVGFGYPDPTVENHDGGSIGGT